MAASHGAVSHLEHESQEQISIQDVFMEQQTYVYLTIEVSEPLYPQPNFGANVSSLTNKYP